MYLKNELSFSDVVNLIQWIRGGISEFDICDSDRNGVFIMIDKEDRELLKKIIED